MAYSSDLEPDQLTALTTLDAGDVLVVGDISDASEVAKCITKANLKTDLGLTGTNSGDQTSIVGITGTKAQFDTACTDGNFLYVGDVTGISDGDKGDITVSGSGATWTIDNGVVTLAKQADMATASVVYRKTAGAGVPEVQTLSTLKTDLGLTGTNSGDQTSIVGITGTKAQFDTAVTDGNFLYVGDVVGVTDGDKGSITVSSSGTVWTLDDSVVTNAKMAGMADATIKGRALSAGAGPATDLTGSQVRAITGLDTTDSPQFTALNVGHASDTTIARVSAGVISVEGVTIPTISSTSTLTNKRVTSRVGTTTSSATPTINTDDVDMYTLTAQAADITSFTTNLSGTPTDGQKLIIRIKGTAARAITWGASFVASTVALPTTTSTTDMLTVGFIYDSVSAKWVCSAVA